jgi:hypothetical protein
MSIGTALTAVGSFLSGPIMTGGANVATFFNLGIGIATKLDTHDMKGTLSGIRSDIHTLDNDILTLTGDVEDFRKENRWNVALSGGTPIQITAGGNPQIAQLQFQPTQQPQAQQVVQPVQQAQPVQQSQAAPTSQYITKDELNGVLNNLVGSIPTIVGQAVQQALTPPVVNPAPVNPTPAPEAKPEAKPGDNTKG